MFSASSSEQEFKGLNAQQSEHIIAIIKHFLDDLPTNQTQLLSYIQQIAFAFNKKLNEENDLVHLQNCIYHPELPLRGIELIGPNVTYADIRKFIFEYFKNKLEKIASDRKINLHAAGWTAEIIYSNLTKESDHSQKYESKPMKIDTSAEDHFYTILQPPGKIYKANLIPDFSFNVVNLNIQLTLNARAEKKEIKEEIFLKEIPYFSNNQDGSEFDEYMKNLTLKQSTYDQAEKKAAEIVLTCLVTNKIISHENSHIANPNARSLITFQTYFDLIKNKIISLNDLNVKKSEYKALITPYMLAHVKTKNDFLSAMQFSLAEIAILDHPFYHDQLEKKQLDFKRDFLNITIEESKNLIFPPIVELLRKNKIALYHAKNMSSAARSVLACDRYFKLIQLDQLEFRLIYNLNEQGARNFLEPRIIDLIEADILRPFRVVRLSNTRKKILCGNHINQLLMDNVISWRIGLDIQPEIANLIEEDHVLFQLLRKYAILIHEITLTSPIFWSRVINFRIAAIENETPFRFAQRIDSLNLIASDIQQLNQRYDLGSDLNQFIAQGLLQRIRSCITKELESKAHDQIYVLLHKIFIGSHQFKLEEAHTSLLAIIISTAQNYLVNLEEDALNRKRLKICPTFFRKSNLENFEKVQNFCEQLNSLCLLNLTKAVAYQIQNKAMEHNTLKRMHA